MKKYTGWMISFGLIFAPLSMHAEGLLSRLFHYDFEVITNADVTPVGKNFPRATPDKPVYYMAVSAGYRDIGGIIAGDKVPPQEQMINVITKVLAKQGYLLATNKNPPTLIVEYQWGTLYPDYMPIGLWSGGAHQNFNVQVNPTAIVRFLRYNGQFGPPEWLRQSFPELSPGLSFGENEDRDSLIAATQGYYIMALAAYDFAAAQQKQAQLVWRTRIATPARGFSMDSSLPKMIAIAAPFVGRDTNHPVHIKASDHYQPDIQYGEPSVVPDRTN